MRKLLAFFVCIAMLAAVLPTAYAAESDTGVTVSRKEYTLENGLTVIEEITEIVVARSSTKYGEKRTTLKDGDTTIAIIAFIAQFGYDGSSSWVVSKTVTQTNTYDGWSYRQTSFTESGATVTLSFVLSKWLIFNNSYSMRLTCDKDGNLS